jgi:hypothetical protein
LSIQVYNNPANQKISFSVPTISGTAKVGHTLVALFKQAVLDDGFSSAADVNYFVWWKVGTSIVASGTTETFAVQPSDIGQKISVDIEASQSGYTPQTFDSVPTSKVAEGTFTTTGGTTKFLQVGDALTPDYPTSTTPNVTPTFVWKRGSTVLASSTALGAAWYNPVVADIGHHLYVTVTYQEDGYKTLVLTYSHDPFKGLQYKNVSAPVISGYSGNPHVGDDIAASTPDTGLQEVDSSSITWKVGGVTKGTGSEIVVKSSWVGKSITATYTIAGGAYEKLSVTSKATPKVKS